MNLFVIYKDKYLISTMFWLITYIYILTTDRHTFKCCDILLIDVELGKNYHTNLFAKKRKEWKDYGNIHACT